MKKLWAEYCAKFDALSQRERMMIFVGVVVVACFIANALFIDPLLARQKPLTVRMAQQEKDIAAVRAEIDGLQKRGADPDAANRERRDDIRRQIAEIDESLKGMERSLVPAQRMSGLLQDMLTRNPRLQLVRLRTLPVAPLVEKRDNAMKAEAAGGTKTAALTEQTQGADGNVFKHGVEIVMQGSYADLHDYLARLERLPWRMFWARAVLSTEEQPRLKLTLTVFTLSLDKAWLVL